MFLLDTNIWLERFLRQDKSEEVRIFLDKVPSEEIHITDFSFHSIAVVLFRMNKMDALRTFISNAFIEGEVNLISLDPEETENIIRVAREFNLDFDDAYQYACAEKYDLIIISFDADFDRTRKGRKTPGESL